MCGIVGLFLKDSRLEPELGAYLAAMLEELSDRGPDSAGIAIYGAGPPGLREAHPPAAGGAGPRLPSRRR